MSVARAHIQAPDMFLEWLIIYKVAYPRRELLEFFYAGFLRIAPWLDTILGMLARVVSMPSTKLLERACTCFK